MGDRVMFTGLFTQRSTGVRDRVRLWHALALVVSVPIVVASARAIRRDYLPIGDNALIEARGRDVLTSHHPWVGTWSSASLSAGVDLNHPGPLIFDVVALPVRLFGGGPGIAIAVAWLHVAVVCAIVWCAHRIGGTPVAAVTAAFTAGLVWSLGSELLYDPWQPNVLILPFLFVLVLVWGVVAGRHGMLPWAVLVASFCVQTHLSYVFVAPAAVALGAGVVVWRWWSDRDEVAPLVGLRPVWLGAVVGLVAWAQPLVEEVAGPGRGNLSRLATSSGGGSEGVATGLGLATRLVAAVLALPPWWGRSGFVDTIPITGFTETPAGQELVVPGLVGTAVAVVALAVVAALIAGSWWWARRRSDAVVAGAAVVVAVVSVVALVTVAITPIDRLGLSPHKIRWLWPISVFLGITLAVAAVRLVLARLTPHDDGAAHELQDRRNAVGPARAVVAAASLVAVALAALAVPFHAQDSGPVAYRHEMPTVRNLVAQLDALEDRGLVLFDAGGLRFAEPFTAPVMASMQRRGVPFVLFEEGLVRQMGERRRFEGDADWLVYVREGRRALDVSDGVERIAFVPGLAPDERVELDGLVARLAATPIAGVTVPADELAELAWRGEIDLTPILGDDTDRFVDLQRRWDGWGVAVFAEPFTGTVPEVPGATP